MPVGPSRAGANRDSYRDIQGVTAPLIDAHLAVRARLFAAMDKLQHVIVAQYPELDSSVLGLIHGSTTTRPRPTIHRERRLITRREWASLGGRLITLRETIGRLGMDLAKAGSRMIGHQDRFIHASEMFVLRHKLSALAARQHPDWSDVQDSFYGPPPSLLKLA